MQISKYVENKEDPHWGKKEINARHEDIVNFAKRRWSFV